MINKLKINRIQANVSTIMPKIIFKNTTRINAKNNKS